MIPKASSIVKIGAAVAVAVVIILQALQSNEQNKIEKISDAILSLEQKVSTELETVEKDEQATKDAVEKSKGPALLPESSPTPSVFPSPSISPHVK